ncbi:ATP-dependent DNA ligase [Sphingobium jiangsuense]|uniref:DNA ligase (ATP) n=1 Tax=Sphingobium jiangsuense TaxID=870476 RepID=A0A7W6BE32_9SPHN|nr:cisplatin damage response ATP-dependent DNA ligase [Sphingobium jiangsuense]MBB3925205.1 DNA ligase-1 [Sphingobium jiangsuense]GLT02032.1 ATP-dependent DNA ligase [Sphingobium jiangsuense]
MKAFSALLTSLIYTRSRNDKIDLLARYLHDTPDPDRGWALAALTGGLDFPAVKSAAIRKMVEERVDPVLFALSRDYVGDTAETASLLWPGASAPEPAPSLSEAVAALGAMTRASVGQDLAALLDRLDENGRFALLKMATGGMRIGISARLAKLAFAQAFGVDIGEVEEMWHVLTPPYAALFDWAARNEAKPDTNALPVYRPFMLAVPLEGRMLTLADFAVEWKWDGIRVQIVHAAGETRLYSRGGDDITHGFPEITGDFHYPAVLDGELLVRGSHQGGAEGGAASFNALQQRLGRKTVPARMLEDYPAFVRLYDVLVDGDEDMRPLPWAARRLRLEQVVERLPADRFDLSALIEAEDFDGFALLRDSARDAAIEGLMLKRRDSPYVGGRRTGLWYKWKRDPLTADCVLMYAQRGSGKRSSFYSDYTFGCWTAPPEEGGEIVPVGKAYSGFTDEELRWLDSFVRKNTVGRFGSVREVAKTLVLEVAFDSIHASKRHKSGLAMRFPRIARIRRDKPASEATQLSEMLALVI